MSTGSDRYDLLVVGGGINGVGVARDAAGRGLRTLLCEQHDLGAHTSSASTKLIHGGLRYLEFYDFRLVRKSLREREIVLRSAPHIVRPMRFVLPHDEHLRPAWMIRAGLFLYDHLARRQLLPGSEGVNLRRHRVGEPLDPRYTRGFIYSDAAVDDARLVVLTAMDAHERGATVLPRTCCTKLERTTRGWTATLAHASGGETLIEAAAVVNATGPWVDRFLDGATPVPARRHPRIVKGSHIVVPRLFEHDHAYLFQAPDRRIVFAIPYEGDCTLIGTTERDYTGDLATPAIEPAEVTYLLSMANRYFRRTLAVADVRWTFAGLRPLLADPSDVATSVTRDYVLDVEEPAAPLLSIYGGKLTTYRKLAEDVLDRIGAGLGWPRRHWTADAPLPGGDIPDADFGAFRRTLVAQYAWIPQALLDRLAAAYGTRVRQVLGESRTVEDLGEEVLPGLHAREVDYLRSAEWARNAEDILYRRSKLALHLPADAAARLDDWIARHPHPYGQAGKV